MTSPALAGLPAPTSEKSTFFSTAATGEKKIAGAAAATVTLNDVLGPTTFFTTTACDPTGASSGTCALICVGETYRSGAAFPPIVTLVPLREFGITRPCQPFRVAATFTRFVP